MAEAAERGAPLATVGCGTSEHGAMAVAEQLTAALGGRAVVHPRQAFEAMLDPWPGVCIAISHDGGTAATIAAMESARRAGAAVGLVTAVPGAAAAAAADRMIVTPVRDRSWCHTDRATCRRSWPGRRWPAGSGWSATPPRPSA